MELEAVQETPEATRGKNNTSEIFLRPRQKSNMKQTSGETVTIAPTKIKITTALATTLPKPGEKQPTKQNETTRSTDKSKMIKETEKRISGHTGLRYQGSDEDYNGSFIMSRKMTDYGAHTRSTPSTQCILTRYLHVLKLYGVKFGLLAIYEDEEIGSTNHDIQVSLGLIIPNGMRDQSRGRAMSQLFAMKR